MFFWWGGNCPNLGVVNVRILGVVNVRLANNLTPASPVLVAALTDMGFPRERVEKALRQTNNDVDQATNLLLGGM